MAPVHLFSPSKPEGHVVWTHPNIEPNLIQSYFGSKINYPDHRNVPRAPTKLIYYQSLFKNVGVGPTTKCHSCSTLPTLTNVEVARMIWFNNRRTTKNERVFLKHKSCYSFCRTTRDGVLPISMRIAALFYIFFVGDNPNFLFDNKISKQKFHKSYI